MSPSFVGITPSIEMVIAAAIGGRTSLFGAIYGSLLVNFGKTYFSESFPELWLFLLGALFIGVVMVFPDGLAGVDLTRVVRFFGSVFSKSPSRGRTSPQPSLDVSSPVASAVAAAGEPDGR
jgi:urea transport system permease protein